VPQFTPEEGAGARALLDRAIAAKGGLQTLRAIKSITATTTTSMIGAGVQADATTYLEYPARVRIETTLEGVPSVQIFDGESGWVRDPRGVHDVPPPALRDLRSTLRRDMISLLLSAERGALRARLLPDVKDDDGTRHHTLEVSATDLDPVVLYVNPETGLISKQTYVAGGAGRPLIEEVFSDYRPVDGVQIAYSATIRRGGQPVLERRVTAITINAPIDPALFKRPAP
jgi:hypothetical protein